MTFEYVCFVFNCMFAHFVWNNSLVYVSYSTLPRIQTDSTNASARLLWLSWTRGRWGVVASYHPPRSHWPTLLTRHSCDCFLQRKSVSAMRSAVRNDIEAFSLSHSNDDVTKHRDNSLRAAKRTALSDEQNRVSLDQTVWTSEEQGKKRYICFAIVSW